VAGGGIEVGLDAATRARAQSCASMVTAQDSGVWAEWA